MEHELAQLWKWLNLVAGSALTGFFFLAGWMIKIQKSESNKVSREWLERKFEVEIKEEMSRLNDILFDIRTSLLGDLNNPYNDGLRNRVDRNERVLAEYEKRLRQLESGKK